MLVASVQFVVPYDYDRNCGYLKLKIVGNLNTLCYQSFLTSSRVCQVRCVCLIYVILFSRQHVLNGFFRIAHIQKGNTQAYFCIILKNILRKYPPVSTDSNRRSRKNETTFVRIDKAGKCRSVLLPSGELVRHNFTTLHLEGLYLMTWHVHTSLVIICDLHKLLNVRLWNYNVCGNGVIQ